METQGLRRVTLAEMGQRLPHGRKFGGEVRQGYRMRQASQQVEIDVYAARTNSATTHYPGRRIVDCLRVVLDDLYGVDLRGMSEAEALTTIAVAPFVDVHTLINVRYWKRRRWLYTPNVLTCPVCREIIPPETKLNPGELGVLAYDTWDQQPSVEVVLDEAVEVGGKLAKRFKLEVPSWASSYYDLDVTDFRNEEAQRSALVEAAVVEVDDWKTLPARGWSRKVDPAAIDEVTVALSRLAGGPSSWLPAKCPKHDRDVNPCKGIVAVPFSWMELRAF